MKNQKGITLIALVVTIVVLLILAAVSIAMLRGDNGIVSNAQNAKYASVEGEVVDKMNLAYNAVKTDLKVKQATEESYDLTSLAAIAFKELGGNDTSYSSGASIDNYTIKEDSTANTITITYADGETFGTKGSKTGKYSNAIECTITLENDDVSYTAPNKPYSDSRKTNQQDGDTTGGDTTGGDTSNP